MAHHYLALLGEIHLGQLAGFDVRTDRSKEKDMSASTVATVSGGDKGNSRSLVQIQVRLQQHYEIF